MSSGWARSSSMTECAPTFIDAIRTIDRRIVKRSSNVRLAFASWEDFYMIQHVPASALPLQFRESFSRFAREHHDAATLASKFRTQLDPVGLVPLPKPNASLQMAGLSGVHRYPHRCYHRGHGACPACRCPSKSGWIGIQLSWTAV